MPVSKYYHGHGSEVMSDMKKHYGDKKGESVFYATANAKKQGPDSGKGSLEDITFHEEAATSDYVQVPFYAEDGQMGHEATSGLEKNFGDIQCSRNAAGHGAKDGHKIPVDYFGPDTDYRAEEINPRMYGHDYSPAPYKDYFKTEDKSEMYDMRQREEDEYSEATTPGTIPEDEIGSSTAYGATSYQDIKRDVPDHRSFKSQQIFRRSQKEMDEPDVVITSGLDTKKGKDIR